MSARLRVATNLAAAVALAAALSLGALWLADRTRRWEVPRWESGAFVPVRAGPIADRRVPNLWVVPVNPRCPRCVATLQRLHGACERRGRPVVLVVLIVDTPARPAAAALRGLPPVPVWWDRHGVWRRRWGHRLYGEVIQFDASGRFVRTAAAAEYLRLFAAPGTGAPFAPADSNQGGT
jgi:hypothetical protein